MFSFFFYSSNLQPAQSFKPSSSSAQEGGHVLSARTTTTIATKAQGHSETGKISSLNDSMTNERQLGSFRYLRNYFSLSSGAVSEPRWLLLWTDNKNSQSFSECSTMTMVFKFLACNQKCCWNWFVSNETLLKDTKPVAFTYNPWSGVVWPLSAQLSWMPSCIIIWEWNQTINSTRIYS